VCLLGFSAVALGGGLFLAGYRLEHPVILVLLGVLAASAVRVSIKLTPSA
jgi:hypothetical protein